MIHPVALLVTGMLTAMVAIALTALCAAWTVPAWRRRLGGRKTCGDELKVDHIPSWPVNACVAMVSLGIGAGALVAWYGCYWSIVALLAGIT